MARKVKLTEIGVTVGYMTNLFRASAVRNGWATYPRDPVASLSPYSPPPFLISQLDEPTFVSELRRKCGAVCRKKGGRSHLSRSDCQWSCPYRLRYMDESAGKCKVMPASSTVYRTLVSQIWWSTRYVNDRSLYMYTKNGRNDNLRYCRRLLRRWSVAETSRHPAAPSHNYSTIAWRPTPKLLRYILMDVYCLMWTKDSSTLYCGKHYSTDVTIWARVGLPRNCSISKARWIPLVCAVHRKRLWRRDLSQVCSLECKEPTQPTERASWLRRTASAARQRRCQRHQQRGSAEGCAGVEALLWSEER